MCFKNTEDVRFQCRETIFQVEFSNVIVGLFGNSNRLSKNRKKTVESTAQCVHSLAWSYFIFCGLLIPLL